MNNHRQKPSSDKSPARAVPAYPPEETIGFLVWDTIRTFHRIFQFRVAAHGISFGLWPFLRALWAEDGIGIREMSRRVHMSAPTTVRAVQKLERQRLVKRSAHAEDARRTSIFLTPKGRALFSRLVPDIDYVNRTAVKGLTIREQNEVRRLLKHMRAMVAEASSASPARRNKSRSTRSKVNRRQ